MSEQTVVTARMSFIQLAHTESGDGTCDLCLMVWPCDAGVVLAELARLTGDVAALRGQLAETEEAKAGFRKAYQEQARKIARSMADHEIAKTERDESREHLAAEQSARAALVKSGDALADWVGWWLSARREEERSKFTEMRARLDAYRTARALLDQQPASVAGPRAAVEEK